MYNFENAFPNLTEFMDKCLYQEAADSFEEAVSSYKLNGPKAVQEVLDELNRILEISTKEDDLLKYIRQHCDYMDRNGARATLLLFQSILRE